MNSLTNSKTLSPFRRVRLAGSDTATSRPPAGFDLDIRYPTHGAVVRLMKGPEVVDVRHVTRIGAVSRLAALKKIQNNTWGPTSKTYLACVELAAVAEALVAPAK
jgi:hypothetical protein